MTLLLSSRLGSRGALVLTCHRRPCQLISKENGPVRLLRLQFTQGPPKGGMFQRKSQGKAPPRKQIVSPRVKQQPQQQVKQQMKQKPNTGGWGDSVVDNGPVPRFFYMRHDSTILKPQYSGKTAWAGLLSLTGINFAVLMMWNEESADEEWMMENFTTDLTNFAQGRVYTLGTASISHQNLMHYLGNMFALWLFGFNTYRVIGTTAFYGLYAAGGVACSATHLLSNLVEGKTEPPLTQEERKKLEELASEYGVERLEHMLSPADKERLEHADKPSLGASGSVMAISAVAAALFPMDKINSRGFYIPLPLAVGMYVLSDMAGLTQEGQVDHAGHLGGFAMGMLYVTAAWYSKSGSFRILHGLGTAGQLPIVYRYRQMFGGK